MESNLGLGVWPKVSPPTCENIFKGYNLPTHRLKWTKNNIFSKTSFEPVGNFTNLKKNFQTIFDLLKNYPPLPQIFGMAHGWEQSRFKKRYL